MASAEDSATGAQQDTLQLSSASASRRNTPDHSNCKPAANLAGGMNRLGIWRSAGVGRMEVPALGQLQQACPGTQVIRHERPIAPRCLPAPCPPLHREPARQLR